MLKAKQIPIKQNPMSKKKSKSNENWLVFHIGKYQDNGVPGARKHTADIRQETSNTQLNPQREAIKQ